MGATCANRRPTFLALAASACSSGSDSWRSRSACSTSNVSIAVALCVMIYLPRHLNYCPKRNRRPACAYSRQGRAPAEQLLVGGLALSVALLEAGNAAAAVEDLLLAGIERVAL